MKHLIKKASKLHFNPRAPCGARPVRRSRCVALILFQPTRPLRGATENRAAPSGRGRNFNPRAPCGARRGQMQMDGFLTLFQPTRPLRGATLAQPERQTVDLSISTHAPLAGRDMSRPALSSGISYFNPRAPCGARPTTRTPPRPRHKISTHAPLAGRDVELPFHSAGRSHFNPRAPCGARQQRDPE